MKIRPLEARDVERAVAMAAELPHAPHWPPSAYLEALQPDAIPRRLCLAIEDPESGTLDGFLVALLVDGEADLETIAVSAASQRQGLGQQLLTALLLHLRQENVTEVMLEVRASNQAALALYRRAGFVQTGRRRGYYIEPIEDALLMSLRLGSAG